MSEVPDLFKQAERAFAQNNYADLASAVTKLAAYISDPARQLDSLLSRYGRGRADAVFSNLPESVRGPVALCTDQERSAEFVLKMAGQLVRNPAYVPQAVDAMLRAVPYALYRSVLQQDALAIILEAVPTWPEIEQRVDAARVVARYAPLRSVLEKQAVRIWQKSVQALPEVGQQVGAAQKAAHCALVDSLLDVQAKSVWTEVERASPGGESQAAGAASGSEVPLRPQEARQEAMKPVAPSLPPQLWK